MRLFSPKCSLALRLVLLACLYKEFQCGGRFSNSKNTDMSFPDNYVDYESSSDLDQDLSNESISDDISNDPSPSENLNSVSSTTESALLTKTNSSKLPPEVQNSTKKPLVIEPPLPTVLEEDKSVKSDSQDEVQKLGGSNEVSGGVQKPGGSDEVLIPPVTPKAPVPNAMPSRPKMGSETVPGHEENFSKSTMTCQDCRSRLDTWLRKNMDLSTVSLLLLLCGVLTTITICCCLIYCRQKCKKVRFDTRPTFFVRRPRPESNQESNAAENTPSPSHPFSRKSSLTTEKRKSVNLLGSVSCLKSAILQEERPSQDLEGLDLGNGNSASTASNSVATLPVTSTSTVNQQPPPKVTSANEEVTTPTSLEGAASLAAQAAQAAAAEEERYKKALAVETARLQLERETRIQAAATLLRGNAPLEKPSSLGKYNCYFLKLLFCEISCNFEFKSLK